MNRRLIPLGGLAMGHSQPARGSLSGRSCSRSAVSAPAMATWPSLRTASSLVAASKRSAAATLYLKDVRQVRLERELRPADPSERWPSPRRRSHAGRGRTSELIDLATAGPGATGNPSPSLLLIRGLPRQDGHRRDAGPCPRPVAQSRIKGGGSASGTRPRGSSSSAPGARGSVRSPILATWKLLATSSGHAPGTPPRPGPGGCGHGPSPGP